MAVSTKPRRASTEPRDTQRRRVYNAEAAFHKATPRLETVPEMQAYVDWVTGLKWWQKRTSCHRVRVTDGRSRRRGNCDAGLYSARIAMPKGTRNIGYLLHELAHAMTYGGPPHGPRFVTNYLLLVKRFRPADEFEALLASFREHRVDWAGCV